MKGFCAPNYTQVPNDFFDMTPEMGEAELRVVLCIVRETFGFHRPSVAMSIRGLARATGLTPRNAWEGAERAIRRGLITKAVSLGDTTVFSAVVTEDTAVLLQGIQTVSPDTGKPRVKESKESRENKKTKKETAAPRAASFPEVVLFHTVTKRYPVEVNYQDVCTAVKKVNHRVGHVADAADLLPFFKQWCARGFNPTNLGWLDWAISGKIPLTTKRGRAPVDEETRHARAKSKIEEFVESAS